MGKLSQKDICRLDEIRMELNYLASENNIPGLREEQKKGTI